MHRKKKGQILYIAGRDDQITTSAKLLDITHESYGFSAVVIETIMNINVASLILVGVITGPVALCEDSW